MSIPEREASAFEPPITFEDVWMGFDEGPVLRGVTFQVQQRETLILLGETGTGKTLTLKMAAGLLTPNGGSVIVLGNEVSKMKERELLAFRHKIGFVFQEGALFDSMSDRKSTRLNSSHLVISYAVFCLKKKISIYAAT